MNAYLLDTHAFYFWVTKTTISDEFIDFLDAQNQKANLLVSSVSFWELALLCQAGRITISNVNQWKNDVLKHSGITLIDPNADEMIASTLLPKHHKDPFDRLLISQASRNKAFLVTRDKLIKNYNVKIFWM